MRTQKFSLWAEIIYALIGVPLACFGFARHYAPNDDFHPNSRSVA